MSNIMKIRAEAWEIISMLDDTDGEVTQEVAELYKKLMQSGQAAVAILADIRDELEARMAARKAKAAELTALAKKDEAMLDNNKRYLVNVMESLGTKKVTVGALQVTLVDGRESVFITDEDAVPDKYKQATITIPASDVEAISAFVDVKSVKVAVSKTAIMDAHKASGGQIGIVGAEVRKGEPHVRIRG